MHSVKKFKKRLIKRKLLMLKKKKHSRYREYWVNFFKWTNMAKDDDKILYSVYVMTCYFMQTCLKNKNNTYIFSN